MAKKQIPYKKAFLPIADQIIAMKNDFPHFIVVWDKNVATWTGNLQPTPLSKIYTVRIVYSLGMSQPNITILTPVLKERKGEAIPHVYPGNKLCLFRPKKKEWTKEKLISKTILPWTSLWLHYYELWHVTGEWLGGGATRIAPRNQRHIRVVVRLITLARPPRVRIITFFSCSRYIYCMGFGQYWTLSCLADLSVPSQPCI